MSKDSTIMDWLVRQYPTAKRQTLRRMVQSGRVFLNGKPVGRVDIAIAPGDKVESRDQSTEAPPKSRNLPFEIIYEDQELLVVNKPSGMLTSTVPREHRPTLLAHIREYLKATDPRARAGLIHRLDREASGLLVFSKTDRAYQSLKTQFFHHEVDRHYTAIVHGVPREAEGRIETRLVERTDGTVHTTRQIGRGMIAITEYKVVEKSNNRTTLSLKLQTGRKHQIRVQLAGIGHPVVGDKVYGPDTKSPAPRLMLAATHLALLHPATNKKIAFQSPAPFAL